MTLFLAVMAHKAVYPDIWIQSVYEIEWFGQALPKERVVWDKDSKSGVAPPHCAVEYAPCRKEARDIEKAAPWASPSIRRGVDLPFATKPTQLGGSPTKTSTHAPTLPLSLPDRTASGNTNGWSGSRFVERFRESTLLARPETTSQFSSHFHARQDSNSFPGSVVDADQPIPLPRLSEWINAEGQQARQTGGSGHSRNHSRWI